jgi:hypothetical protein
VLALFIVITGCSSQGYAQEELSLIIDIYDSENWNESAGFIIYEGRTYDVAVSTENDSVILGANITVLGTTYETSLTEPYITIQAPEFIEADTVIIRATKEGYQNATVELSVLKGELSIVTDQTLIQERQQFQVTVTDQDDKPVPDAFIYFTEEDSPILTDQQGKAFAYAPDIDVFTTLTIQVIKSGYLPGSTIIRIENVEASLFDIPESRFLQILPVLIALLVVILSIIYVFLRNRKSQNKQKQPIYNESPDGGPLPSRENPRLKNEHARYPENGTRNNAASRSDTRVEEIRIPVQTKKKETTYLSEEYSEESIEDSKKKQDEWFKGQDYMRYKLDELTGKIDQRTDGKWFEGEHTTQDKVDEALKKSLKKKKKDEEKDTTK